MKNFTQKLSTIALVVTASMCAQADVRINGFANLTAGKTTDDVNLFGQGDSIDFSNASLFALQVSGEVAENITATAQVLARGSENYSAEFEWAYLTYNINDNSSVTVGRFRQPVFRYSTSKDVGYSYHWISAPQTVYDVAFNNLNGVRYDYNNYVDDFEYIFQIAFGNYVEDIGGGTNTGEDSVLLSAEGNYNGFKARLVWGRNNNQFSSPSYDAAVAGFDQQISAAAAQFNISLDLSNLYNDLAIEDDEGVFLGIGLEYDNFDWFISGEYTVVELEDSFAPDDKAFYVTAGLRLGKWTPHFTHQARDGRGDIKFENRYSEVPAPFVAGVQAFNTGFQASFFEDYAITTLGVRYDATTNVALKAEISKYDNKIEPQINQEDAPDTTLLNVSVNYVF